MNIALATTHLNAGGITSYLLTLAKGFIDQGHNVFLISSGGNVEKDFKDYGAKCLTLDIRTKSELSFKLLKGKPTISQYCHDNDIDIFHSQTRVTQVLGARLSKTNPKIKYFTTCHGFFKPRWSRRVWPCWGEKVIAIGEAVYDHLINDFNCPKDQIKLIPNGIDINFFSVISEKERQESRGTLGVKDELAVGIVARLSDVKGQDVLIDAWSLVVKECPEARLFLVGEGKMEYELKKQVKKLDLTDSIGFCPVVNHTRDYLAALDVFVMPSRQEGLGLSVLEAQSCGLPVVGSRVGGLPSIIEEGETGLLVESQNPHDLAKAIVRLLKDQDLRKSLGLKARQHVVKDYSAERMVKETLATYQELLSG